jgi:hypothetical protein
MTLNKTEILKEMKEYGKTVGYPEKINPRQFIERGHLEKMFEILLSKKLVKPEMLPQYLQAAKLMYQFWYIRNR